MLILIKNANVYAPNPLGIKQVLLAGDKVLSIGDKLDERLLALDEDALVIDAEGATAIPGLIDLHVHVTGGGGESGFASRVPELAVETLLKAGVTTVVGLLGTDSVTRSLEALYAKVCALNTAGMTAYMLTGAYSYPSPTLTGDVARDIVLIDRVIGTKIALSDHRSAEITQDEFLRLAAQTRMGGLIAGKPGLVTIHMGSGRRGLEKVLYAAEHSDIPLSAFLPTHVGRRAELTREALAFAKMGGNIDFTADEDPSRGTTASLILEALKSGVDGAQLTVSSDSGGSLPVFDAAGRCVSMGVGTPGTLLDELRRMTDAGLPLEQALQFFTVNPARRLRLENVKGTIQKNADADLVLLNARGQADTVITKGKLAVRHGRAIIRGQFSAADQ